MNAPHAKVVTARRLGAFAFALVLSAQPVVLCCSAHAAAPGGARHHDGAAHHEGAPRHHGNAGHEAPPAPTMSAACTTDVAQPPALRERTREATPIPALPGSPAGLPLPAPSCSEIGLQAITPPTLGDSRHATPLRL